MFPAGVAVDSCAASCAGTSHRPTAAAGGLELRWWGCALPAPAGPATVVNVTVQLSPVAAAAGEDRLGSSGGGFSITGAAVAGPAGAAQTAPPACLQSLTVPDLRTIAHAPSDKIFTPYFFGSLAHRPPAWDSDDPTGNPYPERRAATNPHLPWAPNGWSRTMGYMAWIGGGASAAGLYMGSHDPIGRLKMMPAAVANTTTAGAGAGGELAVMRALHAHPLGFAAVWACRSDGIPGGAGSIQGRLVGRRGDLQALGVGR
eukprot:SAG22_NODE_1371_length_4582_cov_3.882222_3_plen_259_part_00